MGALRWQTHLNPVLGAGLILGLVVWLIILYRRLRKQHPAKQAIMLLVPKMLIVLLVILAYFDPLWTVIQRPGKNRKLVVLVDTSSSMEVEDKPESTRAERAARLVEELNQKLESSYIDFDNLAFDMEVHELAKRNEGQAGARNSKKQFAAFGPTEEARLPRVTYGGQVRETDLGKCLVTMADRLDSAAPTGGESSYMGVILITDGGDEAVQNVRLPDVPVYITGVGSEPETWNDIVITTVDAPEVVEELSDFEVAADIVVRSVSGDFAARAGQVRVGLEEESPEGWQVRATELVDLAGPPAQSLVRRAGSKARARFRVEAGPPAQSLVRRAGPPPRLASGDAGASSSANLDQTTAPVSRQENEAAGPPAQSPPAQSLVRRAGLGMKKYRVRVETIEGELSELNNARTFTVEIRKSALPVLLFAQEVGWDFSMIRKELARDPLMALTSLFRISDDRFIVQSSRNEGGQNLEAGFASDKASPPEADLIKAGGAGLGLFRCVIVGSLPASQWQKEQLQALVEYVRQGGAVIFLGGEHSFGRGGYSGTVIEPLFPWQISDAEPELQTGRFTVSVPLSAVNHSIVSEMSQLISQAGAAIESINLCGPLRSGAISLLDASVGGKTVPVVALQRYGQGQTMAIATNTLWKWTYASLALGQAYGHFWRQAVRSLSQWEEGERFIGVKWDKKDYRPGEKAVTTIRVAGRYNPGQLHLKATLKMADSQLDTPNSQLVIPVEPVVGSAERRAVQDNTFIAEMVFSKRAEYLFEVHAYVGEKLLESYEKTLLVGPRLNEGANLEVDHAFLDDLAVRGGGAYFREADFDGLIETLRSRLMDYAVSLEIPLVQDRYIYLLIFLIILMLEWTLRRKMNLF